MMWGFPTLGSLTESVDLRVGTYSFLGKDDWDLVAKARSCCLVEGRHLVLGTATVHFEIQSKIEN